VEFILAMFENEPFRQDLFEIQLEHYRRRQEWFRNLAQSGQLLDLVEFTGEPGRSCNRQRGSSLRVAPFVGEGETFTGFVTVKAKDFDAALEIASSADAPSAIKFRALPQFCISTPIPFTSSMFE
jgi:hypothetical protein